MKDFFNIFGKGKFSFSERYSIIGRMIKSHLKGDFKIRTKTIIITILGIIYIVSPIDLIPGLLIPIIGILDDITVGFYVINKVDKEIARFLDWEQQSDYTIIS